MMKRNTYTHFHSFHCWIDHVINTNHIYTKNLWEILQSTPFTKTTETVLDNGFFGVSLIAAHGYTTSIGCTSSYPLIMPSIFFVFETSATWIVMLAAPASLHNCSVFCNPCSLISINSRSQCYHLSTTIRIYLFCILYADHLTHAASRSGYNNWFSFFWMCFPYWLD